MKAFILANISDVLSTFVALNLGGIEANPIISYVMEATSVPEALLIKLAAATGIGLLIGRWKPRVLGALALVFSLIAVSNSLVGLSHL